MGLKEKGAEEGWLCLLGGWFLGWEELGRFKGQGEEGSGFFHRVDPPRLRAATTKSRRALGEMELAF